MTKLSLPGSGQHFRRTASSIFRVT